MSFKKVLYDLWILEIKSKQAAWMKKEIIEMGGAVPSNCSFAELLELHRLTEEEHDKKILARDGL